MEKYGREHSPLIVSTSTHPSLRARTHKRKRPNHILLPSHTPCLSVQTATATTTGTGDKKNNGGQGDRANPVAEMELPIRFFPMAFSTTEHKTDRWHDPGSRGSPLLFCGHKNLLDVHPLVPNISSANRSLFFLIAWSLKCQNRQRQNWKRNLQPC